MNSILNKGSHLEKVNVRVTLDNLTDREIMDAAFFDCNCEGTANDLDFDFLSKVCPMLSPPSLEDVADVLHLDSKFLDSQALTDTTSTLGLHMNSSKFDESFSLLDQLSMVDTFTSEDQWPI